MKGLSAAALLCLAQAPVPTPAPPTFRVDTEVVELDVSVTRGGKHVAGLTAADFSVLDSGVPQEVELAAADADALEAILRGAGFRPVFRYQKYRETYRLGEVEIVVDETPIGTFLEIEGPPPQIHATASALGMGPRDYVTASYAALFFASGGKGDMVFPP